jgi:2-oxoglutarate ferredoxin oxidoreductase subunit beta
VVEDNGVYGLTKGQFSATADVGSTSRSGVANELPPVDLCAMAIQLGATFVARSFSGDKRQLSALLQAAIAHRGTALVDVVSPCVTFNDHEGSTKSFAYVKEHAETLSEVSFVPAREDIQVEYAPGTSLEVTMHDGSRLRLSKLEEGYDPRDPLGAVSRLMRARAAGEVLTGLLYLHTGSQSLLERLGLVEAPLATLPEAAVRPPRAVLDALMDELR